MATVTDILNANLADVDHLRVTGDNDKIPTKDKRKLAQRLGYVKIPNVINLSYSRLSVLHSCPRKFYLRELAIHKVQRVSSVHTAFGSVFGAGIQELLRTGSIERALVFAFAHWDVALTDEIAKANKSIWSALNGVMLFYENFYRQFQEGYELAYFGDKPGIELFFLVWFNEQYNCQGHVDIVLRRKSDGKFVVLELKSSGWVQHEANWKNSEQTLGYSVIIDALAQQYGVEPSFEVEYLIYNPQPKMMNPESDWGFTNYTFKKSAETKADFVLDVMCDISIINQYLDAKFFPKRGSACHAFNRVCEYFGLCDTLFRQLINQPLLELHAMHNEADDAYELMTVEDVDFVTDCDTLVAHLMDNVDSSEFVEDLTVDNTIRDLIEVESEDKPHG